MTDFLQLLISGLATGAIYALAAIGFTLLWQTSQTINFAQGEFVMLPAFLALVAMRWFGVPFVAALVLAILASMLLLGVAFSYIIVDPLIRRGVLPLVISTIALSILLKESVKDFYSAEAQTFPTLLPDTLITVAGVSVSLAQLGVLAVALVDHRRCCSGSWPARAPAGRCRRRRRTRPWRASWACRSSA